MAGKQELGTVKGFDVGPFVYTGTYTGDGSTSLPVSGLGFRPKYVRIWSRVTSDAGAVSISETSREMMDDHADGGSVDVDGAQFRTDEIISLDPDGFTVDDDGADQHPNVSGTVYNFLALG